MRVLIVWFIAAAQSTTIHGVYTKAQAVRGERVYGEACARCHAPNLMGGEGSPALAGEEFLSRWNGKSAGDLFERTRKTMPSDDPASLSRQQYADLIAYLLSANAYAPGEQELPRELPALNQIRIEVRK
jgi:mono/diheme cytochrome c family protein